MLIPTRTTDTARRTARQKEKALRERTVWSDEYGSAEADAKRHTDLEEESRRKAQELVERRDAIRNGGLDAQEEEHRLREIAEELRGRRAPQGGGNRESKADRSASNRFDRSFVRCGNEFAGVSG